jgi:hypothetical protein
MTLIFLYSFWIEGAKVDRFRLAIGHFGQIHFIYGFHYFTHQSVQVFMIRPDSDNSNVQALPDILIPDFSYRDIEIVPDPVLDRFGDPSLYL